MVIVSRFPTKCNNNDDINQDTGSGTSPYGVMTEALFYGRGHEFCWRPKNESARHRILINLTLPNRSDWSTRRRLALFWFGYPIGGGPETKTIRIIEFDEKGWCKEQPEPRVRMRLVILGEPANSCFEFCKSFDVLHLNTDANRGKKSLS